MNQKYFDHSLCHLMTIFTVCVTIYLQSYFTMVLQKISGSVSVTRKNINMIVNSWVNSITTYSTIQACFPTENHLTDNPLLCILLQMYYKLHLEWFLSLQRKKNLPTTHSQLKLFIILSANNIIYVYYKLPKQ